MPHSPSNYPPGVTGNEPEIAGDPYEEVYDMSSRALWQEYQAVNKPDWDGDPAYKSTVEDAATDAGLLDEPDEMERSEAQAAYDDFWRL